MLTTTCKTRATLRPRMFRFSSYIAPRPLADISCAQDPPSPVGVSVAHAAVLRAPFSALSMAGAVPAGDAQGLGQGLQVEGTRTTTSPTGLNPSPVTPGGEEAGAGVRHSSAQQESCIASDPYTTVPLRSGVGGSGGQYAASMEWRDPTSDRDHDQEDNETEGRSETVPVFGYLDSFAARSCPSKAHLPFYVNDLAGALCDAFRNYGRERKGSVIDSSEGSFLRRYFSTSRFHPKYQNDDRSEFARARL